MVQTSKLTFEKYFEQESLWRVDFLKDIFYSIKVKIIFSFIPKEVKSILDVGCGNGSITNLFMKDYNTVGIDRSGVALRYVEGKKTLCLSDSLPFKDETFDLVFSNELLEHLPKASLERTVKEMKRISKKYILISVPNRERIEYRKTKCKRCECVFHVYGHLRNFTPREVIDYFSPEYKLKFIAFYGKLDPYYNKILLYLKQRLGGEWFWCESAHPICPRCGNRDFYPYHGNYLARICDRINNFLFRKRECQPWWMILLLERKYA